MRAGMTIPITIIMTTASALSVVDDDPIPYAAIATFLELLQSTQGEKLLRMKGIVELS